MIKTTVITLGIGVGLVAGVAAWSNRSRDDETPAAEVTCTASAVANVVACSAHLTSGAGASNICFEVIATCTDGDHRARECAVAVKPGSTQGVSVSAFSPALGGTMQCSRLRVDGITVTLRPPGW